MASTEPSIDPMGGESLFFLIIVANLGMLMFGYEVGAVSWMILCIEDASEDSLGSYFTYVADSDFLLGFVAAGASLGAAMTYPVLMAFANTVNKKFEIMMASFFYFCGALLQSVAGQLDWDYSTALFVLLVGRLLYGMGIAMSLHSVPQYISELVPAKSRGQYGATTESTVMLGVTLGFSIGYLALDVSDNWVMPFRVGYIIAIVMGLGALFLPTSPIWMMHHQYSVKAIMQELKIAYPFITESAVQEMAEKTLAAERLKEQSLLPYSNATDNQQYRGLVYQPTWFETRYICTPELLAIWNNRTLFRAFCFTLLFNSFKIITGQTMIIYYSSDIFDEAWDDNSEYMELSVIGFLVMRTLIAMTMILLADVFSRRDYMIVGSILMVVGHIVAAVGFLVSSGLSIFLGVYISGFAFEFSFGSLSYFLLNEWTPFYVRSTVNAVGNCLLFSLFFAVVFLFPVLYTYLGFDIMFWAFAVLSAVCAVFLWIYMPETRGIDIAQSYKEIDKSFNRAPQCCWCSNVAIRGDEEEKEYDDEDGDNSVGENRVKSRLTTLGGGYGAIGDSSRGTVRGSATSSSGTFNTNAGRAARGRQEIDEAGEDPQGRSRPLNTNTNNYYRLFERHAQEEEQEQLISQEERHRLLS